MTAPVSGSTDMGIGGVSGNTRAAPSGVYTGGPRAGLVTPGYRSCAAAPGDRSYAEVPSYGYSGGRVQGIYGPAYGGSGTYGAPGVDFDEE
jgi:hypothetical protein